MFMFGWIFVLFVQSLSIQVSARGCKLRLTAHPKSAQFEVVNPAAQRLSDTPEKGCDDKEDAQSDMLWEEETQIDLSEQPSEQIGADEVVTQNECVTPDCQHTPPPPVRALSDPNEQTLQQKSAEEKGTENECATPDCQHPPRQDQEMGDRPAAPYYSDPPKEPSQEMKAGTPMPDCKEKTEDQVGSCGGAMVSSEPDYTKGEMKDASKQQAPSEPSTAGSGEAYDSGRDEMKDESKQQASSEPSTAGSREAYDPIMDGASGTINQITRYWDCCKPTCSWSANIPPGMNPVRFCQKDGTTDIVDSPDLVQSVCPDNPAGVGSVCSDHAPVQSQTDPDLAFAFVAVQNKGACCRCMELELETKRLVVQITNTGSLDGSQFDHFDILIPGGGTGEFENGCGQQWPGMNDVFGHWSLINEKSQCGLFPQAILQQGCDWRFDWFPQESFGPGKQIQFKEVTCPQVLLDKSKCF